MGARLTYLNWRMGRALLGRCMCVGCYRRYCSCRAQEGR